MKALVPAITSCGRRAYCKAAANSGHVSDATWAWASSRGWSDEQLAEAFAYLGLTIFTAYFLNYAATELDLPPAVPVARPVEAG